MTSNIVNLRKARKEKARADKDKQAAENRVRFGRPKAERETSRKLNDIDRARLDGAKIKMPADGPPKPGTRS